MLKINNIHIKYNREIIIDSNLVLNDYGIAVIKGESGSGKTSLIRNILLKNINLIIISIIKKKLQVKNK